LEGESLRRRGAEFPRVTIRFKTTGWWRVSLRDRGFLVPGGSWNDIPQPVKAAIDDHWERLRAYWDQENPHNLVSSGEDETNE
jgi:hypothetical protein